MKITFDWGNGVIREYTSAKELEDAVIIGGNIVIKTKHPNYGEYCSIEVFEAK